MKRRVLKKAQLSVSEIGFGCMSLGSDHLKNQRLIHHAIDGGINYFDTADLYQHGYNEEILGKAIKDRRQEVIVATKVGNEWNASGEGWRWNPSKSYILKAVDKSLQRLGTDYIDIYQLHGGTIDDPIEEVIEAFEYLKEKGKIRNYGLSSIRPNVVKRFVERSDMVSDMLQYSLLDRRPEEQLIPLLANNDVGVIVRGGLAKGFLAGKELSDYLGNSIQSIELLINKMNVFSNEKNGLSQLSMAWVLHNPAVTSLVIGVRNISQLRDVLKMNNVEPLTEKVFNQLASVLNIQHYSEHRI